MALAGAMAQAVQQRGDARVIELTGQLLDQPLHVDGGGPPMLTDPVPRHTQCSMIPALPMKDQLDLGFRDPDDDLLDDRAEDAFANLDACRRVVPCQR